jgi:pyruvate formate lyase activating enzyme
MSSPKGIVFDIEEFAVYDGPGIRSVVFLKGCPLRCKWCHNPESFHRAPERLKSRDLCVHCGACDAVCPQGCAGGAGNADGAGGASKACDASGVCNACGACGKVCPRGALRIVGREMTPEEVAKRILKNAKALRMSGGGVTFSGGEALMQPDFVIETRSLLSGLHAAIETSGYADLSVFARVSKAMDLVLLDVKLADPDAHKKWTGSDNRRILQNLAWLKESGIPFRARVPLIPGVTDTKENLTATARLLQGAKALERVELLGYNRAAGAKYGQLGLSYEPGFSEDRAPNLFIQPFEERGMEVVTL